MSLNFRKQQWKKRVDELYSKKLVDSEQMETLIKMIESPDNENFVVVKQLIKTFVGGRLVFGLNDGQRQAFEEMVSFIENPQHEAVVLKGYAGTGKTFLVKRLIEYIVQTDEVGHIAIGAPTNKAVQVLYKSSNGGSSTTKGFIFEDIFNSESRLVYSTIHKLLGLKEVITDKGEQLFTSDSLNKSELSKYKYLIVDEVSMLDDKLCTDIMMYSNNIRIIFMGDPAQIPPVKRSDSIPFRAGHKYQFKTLELNEIMRQKGDNPIVEASFIIRNNLLMKQPIQKIETKLNDNFQGIVHINPDTDLPRVRGILEQYFKTDAYKKDSDYMKVIAWRNNTVDYINNVVREILYGKDLPRFIVGEKLMARKPVFEKVTAENKFDSWDYWRVLYTTSEELTVNEVSVVTVDLKECGHKLNLLMYQLFVTSYNAMTDSFISNMINVVHEDSEQEYKALLEKAKNHAIRSKQAKDWVCYFNIMKWSADVGYNYAITAHKSQGSTYKNVLILENDIDNNNKILERNRIKYTSYSRASELLYVLRNNSNVV